ncbi:MAG TPA: ABC transporter ATP-binding protein [Polyangiaceae bacterium]|nr:ABC transporter ATP-binding protein [Polyangiaceae bacterium]
MAESDSAGAPERGARVIEYIEVRGVTRLFGATPALRAVSTRFEAASITFLEGPNGAGKSTLLAVIGTVLAPTRGHVVYHPFGSDPELVRPHLGWVAHDSLCYRELSARQNVELAARVYGVEVEGAWERVAKRVGAEALADRRVATLSRGQRQRVALARALVHDPSLLLLDEPWSGLDRASAEHLQRALIEERARGTLVIVVNHTDGLAEQLGARCVRLENGRVV